MVKLVVSYEDVVAPDVGVLSELAWLSIGNANDLLLGLVRERDAEVLWVVVAALGPRLSPHSINCSGTRNTCSVGSEESTSVPRLSTEIVDLVY